jgi:alkylation response protein AidB-like acyl-CoA dehydrogenase
LIESEAAKAENAETLSPAVVEAMRDNKFFWMLVPKKFGGSESQITTVIEVIEQIASFHGSAGWTLMANSAATMAAGTYGSDALAKEMFGGERMAVMALTFAPTGKGELEGDHYKASGSWGFGTGIAHADWVAGALMMQKDGKPIIQADGKPEIRSVFLPKDRIKVCGNWDVTGLMATGSYDWELPEQDIPAEWSFSPWHAPKRETLVGKLGAVPAVLAGHAAVVLGMARGALRESARLATTRKRIGSADMISDGAIYRSEFMKNEALFQAARGLLLKVYGEAQDTVESGTLSSQQVDRIRQVVIWVHVVCKEIVTFAYGSVSGAIREPSILGRSLNDVSVAAHHIQADPNHLVELASSVLEEWAENL